MSLRRHRWGACSVGTALARDGRRVIGTAWPLLGCALLACGGKDVADAKPADDATGLPAAWAPLDAVAVGKVIGSEGDAVGSAVAVMRSSGDAPGAALVVGVSFASRVCLLGAEAIAGGGGTLDDALACWDGEGARDYAGNSVASGGDVDGDGVPEVLVGALAYGGGGGAPNAGKTYLLRAPFDGGSLADAGHGWAGEAAGDQAGMVVAFAGDVDGDGRDEVLVGAPGNARGGPGAGAAYLLRGRVVGMSDSLSEAQVTFVGGGASASVTGEPPPPHGAPGGGDALGSALAGAGDLDGDGLADVVMGAPGSDRGGMDAGAVGLFFGPVADGVHTVDDADLVLTGDGAQRYLGDQVAPGGDLDGDGRDDLLVVTHPESAASVTWVVDVERARGVHPVDDLARTWFVAGALFDRAGAALCAADLDGDGARDLAVGAYASDAGHDDAGAIYLVLGPLRGGAHSLGDADFAWTGIAEGDYAGRALACGADLTGDGVGDLAVGAPYFDGGGAFSGGVWVVTSP